MLFLIQGYAANNLKLFESYLSYLYFTFFFSKQNYLVLPTVCLVLYVTASTDCAAGVDCIQRLESFHRLESKSWPAGMLGLWMEVAWEAYGFLMVLSYSLNSARTIICRSVGRTTLHQTMAWTPVWEPHMHYLYSLWSKMCHDVICCGQIEDWSKLLGFSYLSCVHVTNKYVSLFWQMLLKRASNKQ